MSPDLTEIIALGSVTFTLVNFLRFALATDWSSMISQLLAWLAGILSSIVVAHTDLGDLIGFGATPISQLSVFSQILLGLAAASSISLVYQFKQAIDKNDSAVVPSLSRVKRHAQENAAQQGGSAVPQDGAHD